MFRRKVNNKYCVCASHKRPRIASPTAEVVALGIRHAITDLQDGRVHIDLLRQNNLSCGNAQAVRHYGSYSL